MVEGVVDDARTVGRGWITAMTNHFDDDAYFHDEQGNLQRRSDVMPRAMTQEEKVTYWERLLKESAATG